jgi:biopolymer transport protein ExbD/biopolymer transport protein TolR
MAINLNTGGKGKQRPVPVVNVTPLVDVALVVLIILMVVTPMMMKQFYLNLPKKDDNQEKEKPEQPEDDADKPLVMTVDQQGVVRINNTLIAKEELKDRLPRMLAAKRQKVLYFDAHDDLAYVKAVEVLDLSRLGGAKSIAILTQKIVQ